MINIMKGIYQNSIDGDINFFIAIKNTKRRIIQHLEQIK